MYQATLRYALLPVLAGFMMSASAQTELEEELDDLDGFNVTSQFQWRVLLASDMPEEAPLAMPQSKTIFFSVGANIPVARFLEITLSPGLAFTKLRFEQDEAKTFPTDSNNVFEYEKFRGIYFEIPLGFRFNLIRDKKDEVAMFLEAGVTGGVRIGRSYKMKTQDTDIRLKIPKADGLEFWRYGAYGKLTYRNIGVVGFYRLSDYFTNSNYRPDPDRFGTPRTDADGSRVYPRIPPVEVGLTLDF